MAIVTVEKNRYTVEPLYQWDVNQVLEIRGLSLPVTPQIHFTNELMSAAIVRQSNMNASGVITVDIPNSLLQKPYKITVYVCIYENRTFESRHAIVIPMKARTRPADYTLSDNDGEVYSFLELENRISIMENKVANTTTQLDKAKQSLSEAVTACEEATEKTGDLSETVNSLSETVDSKMPNVSGATEGNIPVFDDAGNVADSGVSMSGFTRAKMTLSGTTLTITTV